MPRKKQPLWQPGPSLWDCLEVPQDLGRPLTDAEKYLYMDQSRGIKIPRAANYFRLPSADLPPDCQLTSEEVTALHGRALRSQSNLLLQVGATEHKYAQTFVLFSGGNDSALATHFAMRFFRINPDLGPAKILHLDTGTGVMWNIFCR